MENGLGIARFFLGRITEKSMKEGMGKNLEVGILGYYKHPSGGGEGLIQRVTTGMT